MSGKDEADPRLQFISTLDPTRFRVLGHPGGVFLCGGQRANPASPPASWRDAFARYLERNPAALSHPVTNAEEIIESSFAAPYSDLFELERHIASLSAAVVVIVEGPGSFAEIGAFSQIPVIREKLIAIVDDQHFHDPTPGFLRLGPLQTLHLHNANSVLKYTPPETEAPGYDPLIDITQQAVASDVNEHLANLSTTSTFRADDDGHCMLLVAQLCHHCIALSQHEIVDFCGQLGISLRRDTLCKYAYLLQRYKLLRTWSSGHSTYYLCDIPDLVKLSNRSGSKVIDRERARTLAAEFYKRTDDRRRSCPWN